MATIVPTVLTDDPAIFQAQIEEYKLFSRRIQIDASDGTFAPSTTLPLDNIQIPEGLNIDVHVMSARPSEHLSTIINLRPSLCIVHAEVDDNLTEIITALHNAGIKAGLALLKGTFPGKIKDLIASVDHVMIFAGDLGHQGGAIDMLQIEKAPLIRTIKPDIEIGWDGGANLSNVRALAHAGIDVINIGSALSRAADKAAMYQSLVAESEKKGVLV